MEIALPSEFGLSDEELESLQGNVSLYDLIDSSLAYERGIAQAAVDAAYKEIWGEE